jgi:hypothetical protein
LSTKPSRALSLAFGALVLALTTPLIVAVAAKLGATFGTVTTIASPLIALGILFAFAFHVRFALGALQAAGRAQRVPSILASIAILMGVTGFIGSMLVLMGIVR